MKIFKLTGILSVILLSAMLLGACSDSGTVSTKDKSDETTQSNDTAKKEDSKVGTRTNPIKINEIATIETTTSDDDLNEYKTTIDLSIVEVIRGDQALQKLKQMNEFNEDPPEGYEWALIKSKVKVVDSETEDHPFTIDGIMYFKAVSESGDVYSGDLVGTTNPEFSFEMYKGNEKEGYIAKLVKKGENAQLEYDPIVSNSVFFNLQ